ncbi:cytochrome c biogenesis protein CcmE [Rouxiella silvae]|uniref:Cytochrome c-type biogenesis protein CcmE n=1 Tax=Rouxiella silvae TaxID=1646373 RepID=A0AA40X0S7_9GAMM|nr:cytochrome c maturation protein CcmE [Rouxiella silvae]KQN47047.1 cytochrome C biogenesis protein CcmE [Serratia sp. Leaf50]MBF6636665.1 cytochrome c maturation protein CcmE [Rouxiella silvae]ORJ21159.1 cytochrome c biogenesis protein CcmE [Rouxiella silvae]
MNTRRKNRLYLALIVLVGLGLATTLVMYALRSNIDLFYTPSEILQGKGKDHELPFVGQRLRIGGMVMPGSVKRDDKTLEVHFKIYDARGAIAVTYYGILPDLFREGQGVVAQGVMQADNVVMAKQVLAKHDEKYVPPEVEDAMKDNHTGPASAYVPPAKGNGQS